MCRFSTGCLDSNLNQHPHLPYYPLPAHLDVFRVKFNPDGVPAQLGGDKGRCTGSGKDI